ncbi:MAG TPA: MFS transporter, partial [Bacillota bacterium]|nr:MFS transporter [Bacillota bacterium]
LFPFVGALVERWPKKAVIVATDVARGLLALAFVTSTNMTMIYALSAAMVAMELFFAPAIRTVIPRLVDEEDLLTANALSSLTNRSAALIGPAIGGVLIGLWGVQAAFLINAVSFLVSALSEVFIAVPQMSLEQRLSSGQRRLLPEMKAGWDYLRSSRPVRFVVFFFAMAGIPLGAIVVLKVVLLTDVLGFSAEQYGFLMSIEGVGLVLGSLLIGYVGKRFTEMRLMLAGVGVLGLGFLALSQSSSFLFAGLCLLVVGAAASMANVAYGTFLQKNVADEFRSRVFSFDIAIGDAFALVAMGFAGVLGDLAGVANVMAISGALAATLCLLAFAAPSQYQSAPAASPLSD